MTLLSRRALLARAALTAAAGVGASRLPALPATAPPAAPVALSPARRTAYAALVARVVAQEGGHAGPAYTDRAATAFSGWYERNPNLRAMADHLLDQSPPGPEARALASPPFAPDRA